MKLFSSLDHSFIVLYELLMPCQLFAQKYSNCQEILYTPLFSRTVIFAVLARCGNSRVVNFAILLMLSLL